MAPFFFETSLSLFSLFSPPGFAMQSISLAAAERREAALKSRESLTWKTGERGERERERERERDGRERDRRREREKKRERERERAKGVFEDAVLADAV